MPLKLYLNRRRTVSALAAFALGAMLVSSPSRAATAPAEQPTGEQVIEKYIEVTGGKAAYEKVKTRVTHGKMDIPQQGMSGTIEIYSKAPNLFYTIVDIPGTEKQENAYDGKNGWEKSVLKGTRLLKGQELELVKQQANMAGDLNWREFYKSVVNDGVVDIDGKSCYKLTLTPKMGKPEVRFYDTQTNLLSRVENDMEMMGTTIHSIAKPGDYRESDGIKMPFKSAVTLKVGGMQVDQNVEIEKVETNVEIPDSKFAMPDDVKKLMKDQAEKPADDAAGNGK